MSGKKSHKAKHKKDKKAEKKAQKAKPAPKPKGAASASAPARTGGKAPAKTVAAPGKGAAAPAKASVAPAKGSAPKAGAAGPAGAAAGASPAGAAKPGTGRPAKKSSRRSSLSQRRGPDGELLAPGDLLLPGGAQRADEIQYLFRGCVAAEHPVPEEGVQEIIAKRGGAPEAAADRADLLKAVETMRHRFEGGIEPALPVRPAIRRNFLGVVERARHRRREIGAFLRGLDLGRTETSHMDSHGEASLQSLMEWAARLENLTEADEPDHADYNQFHRGLDQLENTTEALIIDVEQTLRRLRDRTRNR